MLSWAALGLGLVFLQAQDGGWEGGSGVEGPPQPPQLSIISWGIIVSVGVALGIAVGLRGKKKRR